MRQRYKMLQDALQTHTSLILTPLEVISDQWVCRTPPSRLRNMWPAHHLSFFLQAVSRCTVVVSSRKPAFSAEFVAISNLQRVLTCCMLHAARTGMEGSMRLPGPSARLQSDSDQFSPLRPDDPKLRPNGPIVAQHQAPREATLGEGEA